MLPIRRKITLPTASGLGNHENQTDSLAELARSIKSLTKRINDIYGEGTMEQAAQTARMQDRFRKVTVHIPILEPPTSICRQNRFQQLQQWVGHLCQEVFSITFSQFQNQKLSQPKTKSFCCQNMLSNILKMIRTNKLTAQEISHIDNCLKNDLLPYFLVKYPISEEAEVNLQFESKIVDMDSIHDNENDLVFKSHVEFHYNESGNYNRQIMRFLNYILELPRTKIQPTTFSKKEELFKLFTKEMEGIFQMVQSQIFTIKMSRYDFKNKQDLLTSTAVREMEYSFEQQKEIEKYRETVRSYTTIKIGRKISENVKPFSDLAIEDGELVLKNPALMRIVIKWCEELMENFQITRNILNKEEQFRMKDGSQKILKRRHLLVLAQLLKRQKQKVSQYLQKVSQNNSECQFDFSHQQIPKNMRKFCQQQFQVGHFAASTINNYQTYLIGYINTIIHSLMSAVKDYQQMVKAYQYRQSQFGHFIEMWRKGMISFDELIATAYSYRLVSVSDSYYSFIPQLVSFRVGDIMRCRCVSKEKEIIAIYSEIERISRMPGSHMKIMRVKNRLSKGTRDILINILYLNKILIQIQLGISKNVSKFIDFSNKFNHMLYQLRRSQFGVITQMCNLWINNDIKSQFYINYTKIANDRQSKHDTSSHICQGEPIQFPFRCTECLFFYNDCSYVLKHIQCREKACNRLICSLCWCERLDYEMIRGIWPSLPDADVLGIKQKQKYQEYRGQLVKLRKNQNDFMEGIQASGVLLDLKGEELKPTFYKCVKMGKKTIIVQIVDFQTKQMRVRKQLLFQSQIKLFKKEYLIFTSPTLTEMIKSIQGQQLMRVITEYNFPKLMKKWYEKEKATIVFMNGGLLDSDIGHILNKYPSVVKVCFYQNKLTDFQKFMSKFMRSQIVDVGENMFKKLEIKQKEDFQGNLLKVLYANYNQLESIDPSFLETFPWIEELELANNKIQSLPDLSCLTQLKILNLSRNMFETLPDEIGYLEKLETLYLYSTEKTQNNPQYKKLQTLPESIGNLSNLNKLNLNFNNLTTFPSSIGNLQKLKTLYVAKNKLKVLPASFKQLKNLKVLNLANNQFDDLPEEIGSLTALEILNLENSSKTAHNGKMMPACYTNLVQMKMMDISQNNLMILPNQLGNMKKMETLFIYENKLSQIPSSIGDLKQLRLLYTSNNMLNQLPLSICNLVNLEKLTLKQNPDLRFLPADMGRMTKLKCLIACNTSLQTVPGSLGELQNLVQINLKGNPITSLPVNLTKWGKRVKVEIDVEELNANSRAILGI